MRQDEGRGLKAVAKRAQVSIATASRALNPETAGMVSATTRVRVLEAAHNLRYLPNSLATALKVGRSGVVGVLYSEFRSGLAPAMLDGLQQTLVEHGYWPLLGGTLSWRDGSQRAFEALLSRRVDGLVVTPAVMNDPVLTMIEAASIPAVVAYGVSGTANIPSVTVDDMMGMDLAVAHLAELGHRRIAAIIGPSEVHSAASRARAISAAGAQYRLTISTFDANGFSPAEAIPPTTALLALRPTPTAIIAVSDSLAIGCIKELERVGLRIPRDMSVVGYGDIPLVDQLTPALTTVKVPAVELGKAAGSCILARIGGEEVQDVLLSPEFAVRASTAII